MTKPYRSKVMRDIHKIRERISSETKGMTAREEVMYWREKAKG